MTTNDHHRATRRRRLTALVAATFAVTAFTAGCDLGPGEPPALYAAVSQSDDRQAKRLLEDGSDPNEKHDGMPVLHEAAVVGDLATVRVLLDAGANPCATTKEQGKALRASAAAAAAETASTERSAVVDLLNEAEARC